MQNRQFEIINRLSFHKNIDFKKILIFLYWAYIRSITPRRQRRSEVQYYFLQRNKFQSLVGNGSEITQQKKVIFGLDRLYFTIWGSIPEVCGIHGCSDQICIQLWQCEIIIKIDCLRALFTQKTRECLGSLSLIQNCVFKLCDNLNTRVRYDIVGGYSGSGYRRVLCYCIYIRVRYDIVGGYSGSGFRRVLCYCCWRGCIYTRVRYDIVGGYSGSGSRRVLCCCCWRGYINTRVRYDIVGGYSGSGSRCVLCCCCWRGCIYTRVRYDIVGGYSGSGYRRVLCYCCWRGCIYTRVRYDIVGGYSGSGYRRVLCCCCWRGCYGWFWCTRCWYWTISPDVLPTWRSSSGR